MKNTTSVLLVLGIIIMLNVVSKQLFFRWDLTAEKQYTLSNATKNILKSLEDPITVTAYFSEDIPTQLQKVKRDFQEMLVEFSTLSKGMVDYEFINPDDDEELKQTAAQDGIGPFPVQVRESDQVKTQNIFMGATFKMGEQQEVLPAIVSSSGMEYSLATAIKKMSVVDKPSIGLIQGHGEPNLQDLEQVMLQLSILYNVEPIDLGTQTSIADRFRTVVLLGPKDSIPPNHFAILDDYLGRGGKMVVGINAVEGDFQTAAGSVFTTGLETWLQSKGIVVDPAFVVDANCGSVTVQRRMGPLTIPSRVQFPFFPLVSNFADHPITKGLEQVAMIFASHLRSAGDSTKVFTPFAYTSGQAGVINAPTQFNVEKKWTEADFPLNQLVLGGIIEGNFGGNMPSKMVVFGDADFPMQGGGQNPDNASLLTNSIDWLSDDTGLIELRTKGVVTRPISEEYLGDDNSGKRNTMKYLNFGLPILLIIIYGFLRFQRQRNTRIKRMQEDYS